MTFSRRRFVKSAAASLLVPYVFTSSAKAQSGTSKAFALHIGLDDIDRTKYPAGVKKLNGCVKDANTYSGITKQRKFTKRILLTNRDATSEMVCKCIIGAALKLGSGDTFLVTYAGHGSSLRDVNGDEPDGRDETWCLFDRQFRDDELYELWAYFQSGVRIVVISDSCHSGTVAREMAERGALADEIEKGDTAARDLFGGGAGAGSGARSLDSTADMIRGGAASRGVDVDETNIPQPRLVTDEMSDEDFRGRPGDYAYEPANRTGDANGTVKATGILLAGCQDSELSWEESGGGKFTSQLKKAFDAQRGLKNYATFLGEIKTRMPANQTPNLFPFGSRGDEFYYDEKGPAPFTF
jgi:hypothetical protein